MPHVPRPSASISATGSQSATRPLVRWLSAAVVASVALGSSLLMHPAAAASPTVSAMTFNICGAACHKGEVKPIAAYVVNRAVGAKASVVFLEEVCYSQYRQIKALVEKKGYSTLFTATTSSGYCDNDDRRYGTGFGVAILVKGRSSGRVVLPLPVTAGSEKRALLGATATIGGRSTFVAVVHNSPSAQAGLNGQLKVLTTYLNAKAAKPVIIGGDFNAMPDNPGMAGFYSPAAGGTGRFTELDETRYGAASRSGTSTFDAADRKIDYIFVSRTHFGSPTADSTATSMSDHRVYLGTARVTP
jgi:endonuclease/exonuclease/phosphatase family metal-dependent hydrolase